MAKRYSEKPNPSKVVGDVGNELGTVPPQAIDLEEAVLGALMIEKESILKVQEILKPESFYKVSHQIVYQAILDLSSQLEPVDLYTVYQQLLRKNKLEEIGGRALLVSLTQTVGSAAHIEFHAKIIAQKFVQRELIRASTDIQRRSFDPDTDVTDLIEFAEGEIFKVASGNIKRDVQDAKSIVAQTLQRIEEARKRPEGISGVPCGFTDIDKLTSGWQPSDLIIIAARPSMG
ncbi:MAG: replicative DNA helicase, partial [Rikenellaceae bacterium]|nr:replicative DNA helicase [Rikenellaceae bacterium]